MEIPKKFICESLLRELLTADPTLQIWVVGQTGGYAIVLRTEAIDWILTSARGSCRVFKLDSASKYLSSIGIETFHVDSRQFLPGLIRGPRPDRAMALRSISPEIMNEQ